MRIKNLGFLEQHVEKIVLGVAGAFFLAVMWVYVVQPHRVEVRVDGRTEVLSPSEVNQRVENKIRQLDARLKDAKPPSELGSIRVPDYVSDLRQRLRLSPDTPERYRVTLGPPGLDQSIVRTGDTREQLPRFAIPERPAPDTPLARAEFGVLTDQTTSRPLRLAAYRRTVNPSPFGDFSYVTISSSFDLAAWAGRLRSSPRPRIPEEWWGDTLLVTGVVVERQTLDPDTGKWGGLQEVPLAPGQFRFDRSMAGDSLPAALLRLRASQERITQAEPPPVTEDRPWFPPGVDASKLNDEQKRLLGAVVREMEVIRRQIQRMRIGVQGSLDEDSFAPAAPGAPTGPGGEPAIAPGLTDLPTGPMDTSSVGPLEQRLQELQRQRDAIIQGRDPNAPEIPVEAPPAVEPTWGTPWRPAPVTPAPEPTRGHKIDLMMVDLTARPGHTYRYRISLGLFNPLFLRRQVDPEQQKETLNRLSYSTPPSEWSQPVRVEPDRHYFLVQASVEQRSAGFEVWRIVRGKWRKHPFERIRPGDAVGGSVALALDPQGPATDVDFSVGTVLVDVYAPDSRFGAERAAVMSSDSGRLFERSRNGDKDDPDRQRLIKETEPPPAPKPPVDLAEPPPVDPTVPGPGYRPVGPRPPGGAVPPPGYGDPTAPPPDYDVPAGGLGRPPARPAPRAPGR